ncbi:MAG TPA: bifunctional DNA primase/polymerase, partial [Flavobacteriales bacterium]|nr:bifunctional DNA primase/polymerase [Flavobacteriales bacterium]
MQNNNINVVENQATTDVDAISDEPGEHNERPVLSVARVYVQAGISLIPCGRNKKPMFSLLRMANGQSGWVQYQKRLPTEEELSAWFSLEGGASNLGVVCGNISGGLEVIDFDRKLFRDGAYINVFEDFKLKLESKDPNLLGKLVIAETQNGGVHVKYKCAETGGNQVLAKCLKDDGTSLEAIIETRGEGGYVITPPSNGYRDVQGGLLDVQQITLEERQMLFDLAKIFDRAPKKKEYPDIPRISTDGEEQISDWYERIYPEKWRDLIAQNGWTLATTNGNGIERWTRPGKDVAEGSSATWSVQNNRGGVSAGRFYVFSSNAHPFENGRGYSPFQIFCLLEHNDDWNAAVAEVGKWKRDKECARTMSLPVEAGGRDLVKEKQIRTAGNVTEADNSYVSIKKKGADGEFEYRSISNFFLRPKQRILVDGKEDVMCDFVTQDKTFSNILIPRTCWNDRRKFMDVAPSIDLSWRGSQDNLQRVQEIVSDFDNVPTKFGTTKLGLHSQVWVTPTEVIGTDGVIDDPEIVYLPMGGRGELDNKLAYPVSDDAKFGQLIDVVYENILKLNTLDVVMPVIGWFFAAGFKPYFEEKVGAFPILSIWGTRGSGKSTLLRFMRRLFGYTGGLEAKLFSCTETDFVLMKLFSGTTSIPIILDEYKPHDMPKHRLMSLHRMLRRSYNGESEFRGKQDQTTVEYALTAPLAVAGEVSLSEPALMERIVNVKMSPNDLDDEVRGHYASVVHQDLSPFGTRYVQFVLSTDFDQQYEVAKELTSEWLVGSTTPDRVFNNLVAVTFGFRQFMKFGIQFGCPDSEDALDRELKDAVLSVHGSVCSDEGTTTALEPFIQHLSTMAEGGRLQRGRHYGVSQGEDEVYIRFNPCF